MCIVPPAVRAYLFQWSAFLDGAMMMEATRFRMNFQVSLLDVAIVVWVYFV